MARKLASEDVDSGRAVKSEEPDGVNDSSSSNKRLLNRRDYLKYSAAAVGTVLVSSGSGSAATERHGIQFDRVVDAVDDLGMDPNGNDPIDSALSKAYETGTLIEFPEGTYRVDSELLWNDNKSNFGMRGLGDSHTDVEFIFPNADTSGTGWWFFKQTGGENFLIENLSIQQSSDELTAISVMMETKDNGNIIDVEWLGFVPSNAHSYGQLLRMDVSSESGVNLAKRVTMGRDGTFMGGHAHDTGDNPGTTFVLSYSGHNGEMRFEDCWMEQCGHNTIRSIRGDGVVRIFNSMFLNCDLAAVRVHDGDHPRKNSVVENCDIIQDHSRLKTTGSDPDSHPYHCLGILGDSYEGYDGPTVRDCNIEYLDISRATDTENYLWGVIRVTKTGISNPGPISVKNTRIYNQTPAPNIWIQEKQSGAINSENVFEDVEFTFAHDTTSQGPQMVYVGPGWNGSRIMKSCFHAPNGDVNGIEFKGCDDIIIEDSNINVTGEAVQLIDTDGKVRDTTHDGTCDDTGTTDGSEESGSDDGSMDDPNTDAEWISFVINGTDSNTISEYEFIVDGDARENTELSEYGTVSTVEAHADGTRVAGAVRSGVDAFDYTGSIVSYTAGDDLRFKRDGTEVSRDGIVDRDFEHTLQIVGTGTTSNYKFAVDGEIVTAPECELECEDTVSGTEVAGELSSETASFNFDGNVAEFSLDGDAGVYLNDKQVDPNLLGTEDDPFLKNWLTVDGVEGETTYQFAVSDSLHKSPDLGSTEDDDEISDGMVIGSVSDDIDGYRFNGDVTMMRVQGTADLRFDEE